MCKIEISDRPPFKSSGQCSYHGSTDVVNFVKGREVYYCDCAVANTNALNYAQEWLSCSF